MWVDVSALLPLHTDGGTAITNVQQLCDYLLREARVWLNPGTMYGQQTGEGYVRINIACPRSQLMEGLRRLEQGIEKLRS